MNKGERTRKGGANAPLDVSKEMARSWGA